jgi:hypothetical protein
MKSDNKHQIFDITAFDFPLTYGESLKLLDTSMNFNHHDESRTSRPFIPFRADIKIYSYGDIIQEKVHGQFLLEVFPICTNSSKDIFVRIRKLEFDSLHNYFLIKNNYYQYFVDVIISRIKDWIHHQRDDILFYEYVRIVNRCLYSCINQLLKDNLEEELETILHELDNNYDYTGFREFSEFLSQEKKFFVRSSLTKYKKEKVIDKFRDLNKIIDKIKFPVIVFDWQSFYIESEDIVRLFSYIENIQVISKGVNIHLNKDAFSDLMKSFENYIENQMSNDDIELCYYLEPIYILIYLLSQKKCNDDTLFFNLNLKLFN